MKEETQPGQPPLTKDDFVCHINMLDSGEAWGKSFPETCRVEGGKERSKGKK